MGITRHWGSMEDIVVQTSDENGNPINPLVNHNKDYTHVLKITMNVKRNLATDADDAYLQKSLIMLNGNVTQNNGVSLDQENHTFTLNMSDAGTWTDNGTEKIPLPTEDTDYFLTLNIDVGFERFIEVDLNDRKITITPDTNRE